MKARLIIILSVFCTVIVLFTVGKLGGEKLRTGAVRLFSNIWVLSDRLWRGELVKAEELYQENLFLKKALKEIADGELSPSAVEGKVMAQVIYRPYSDWLSSFWINLGTENGKGLIDMNSPVLYRGALLGIVDYVGAYQSRVLLITDPKLRPAVRVARGDFKRFLITHQIDQLSRLLDNSTWWEPLQEMKNHYLPEGERFLLAKGELRGAANPLSGAILKGVGFNLETGDKAGPARDLRTGVPYDFPHEKPVALIQLYDLLVTTGLDGLFPEGLDVALVTGVKELDEGDVVYEILAEPLFGAVEEIRQVEILPPQPFDPADLPPFIFKKGR